MAETELLLIAVVGWSAEEERLERTGVPVPNR